MNEAMVKLADEWRVGDFLPPVERGHMKEFVLAVYRAHNQKTYSFACHYLNEHRIQYEFCPKDNEHICDGCEDDGCPATGWFILTGDGDNESGCYQTLSLKDGDKIMGWTEIPQWEGRLAAAAASGGVREQCDEGGDHAAGSNGDKCFACFVYNQERSAALTAPPLPADGVREALERIAKQKTSTEWEGEFGEEFSGDYAGGYDQIIETARAALASPHEQGEG